MRRQPPSKFFGAATRDGRSRSALRERVARNARRGALRAEELSPRPEGLRHATRALPGAPTSALASSNLRCELHSRLLFVSFPLLPALCDPMPPSVSGALPRRLLCEPSLQPAVGVFAPLPVSAAPRAGFCFLLLTFVVAAFLLVVRVLFGLG